MSVCAEFQLSFLSRSCLKVKANEFGLIRLGILVLAH